jgi:hypothetical protein
VPEPLRPTRWWYAAAALIAVIGITVGVLLFVDTFGTIAEDFDEFAAPGTTTVNLSAGDKRGIYVQTAGSSLGPVDRDDVDAACQVAGPGGAPVDVEDPSGDFTITQSNDEYEELFFFEAPDDGRYAVTCRASRTTGVGPVPLAVGPHLGVIGLVWRILGGIAAILGGIFIGIGIVVLVAVLRHRNKKRSQQPGAGSGLGG